MNLRKKKLLAGRTFKVGVERIVFEKSRLDEIKEAITKQDIKDLKNDGAINIKPISGKKKNVKRTSKRGVGNVRRKVNTRKKDYVTMTRKLRIYVGNARAQGKISDDDVKDFRKKIRNKHFKSLSSLKDQMVGLKK